MEKDLYKIMNDILQEKKTQNTQDIKYIGTIEYIQKDNGIEIEKVKDVFMMVEKLEDGSTIKKFYDENKNYIAGTNKEGKMFPAESQMYKENDYLKQIEELQNEPGISLNEIKNDLEEISKIIGVKKEEIMQMTQIDLEQEIQQKIQEKEEPQIQLKEKDEKEEDVQRDEKEIKEQNKKSLEKIQSKQEIDLDKKIDNKNTLRRCLRNR